ncbi:MAG: transposase, partial [Gammaproteobacteria bacterium]|nr:transposase [Gammaproteobacteria bacterium]
MKSDVRRLDNSDDGILSLDDMVSEKPYTDENLIMCWHYSHAKNRVVKGVNILTMMVRYGDISLPVGYEIVKKDISYSEIATKK